MWYAVQAVTDEDLAAGLDVLADRLHKPSKSSSDAVTDFEIPEKYPMQSMQESSGATVTMPTATLIPFAVQSLSAVAPVTNQISLISELPAADWPMLIEGGSTSTAFEPLTQSTTFVPVTFAENNDEPVSAPPRKKIVLLVAKRPSSSLDQSRSRASTNSSAATVMSSHFPSMPTSFLASSAAEANSMVPRLTTLCTDLPSQELDASCTVGSSGQFGPSEQLQLLEDHSGSSLGHVGSSECHLKTTCGDFVSLAHLAASESHTEPLERSSENHFGSSGHVMSSEGHTASSEGHLGSSLHDSALSVKQFLDVSDLYSCS